MKYRSIIAYAILLTIIISTMFIILLIPIVHTESISLIDSSKLKISTELKEYSNSLSVQNSVNVSISLVKLADETKNVQITKIYRLINYFDNEEMVLDFVFTQPTDEIQFEMNFFYSSSWGRSDMKFKFDYIVTNHNDSEISSNTGWLSFITLRPVPNMKGIITVSIASFVILLTIGVLTNVLRKSKGY